MQDAFVVYTAAHTVLVQRLCQTGDQTVTLNVYECKWTLCTNAVEECKEHGEGSSSTDTAECTDPEAEQQQHSVL